MKINGPNGFFREFRGNPHDPAINISLEYARGKGNSKQPTGNIELQLRNLDRDRSFTIEIKDNAYGAANLKKVVGKAASGKENISIPLNLHKSYGWYDLTIRIAGVDTFEKRYAGHVETGVTSRTDPAMGNIL